MIREAQPVMVPDENTNLFICAPVEARQPSRLWWVKFDLLCDETLSVEAASLCGQVHWNRNGNWLLTASRDQLCKARAPPPVSPAPCRRTASPLTCTAPGHTSGPAAFGRAPTWAAQWRVVRRCLTYA